MTAIANKTALITGGASGIGKRTGRILLEKGLKKLIIWDINKEAAEAAQKELSALGEVYTYPVNISSIEQTHASAHALSGYNHYPDILINNVGIVKGEPFSQHNWRDISDIMTLNTVNPMRLTGILLKQFVEKGDAHIVNIASAAGMIANPNMSVYAASKWALIGWSESLRLEMESMQTGVRVTTVTPYYIKTGMFRGVKTSPLLPMLEPEKVARSIVRGIEKNKVFVRTPAILYLLPLIKGILPVRIFDWIVGKKLKVYHSMDHFKGHEG